MKRFFSVIVILKFGFFSFPLQDVHAHVPVGRAGAYVEGVEAAARVPGPVGRIAASGDANRNGGTTYYK
jgi:hypothetical protein